MSTAVDMIVVGAGGSGLAAALSAAERGLSVLLLEKCAHPGGTTGMAIGSFTASGTELQRSGGFQDTADAHAVDAALFADAKIECCNNPELRNYFLQEASRTLEWLIRLGVRFHGPFPEPPNRVPRMHNVIPNARAYVLTLLKHLRRHRVRVQCNVQVTGLIHEHGRVCGVQAETAGGTTQFLAHRAVVLAAGDYANSPELIARFRGSGFSSIDGINPDATGDGHRLVEQAGGKLINMGITYGPELRFVPPPPDQRSWITRLPAGGWFPKLAAWCLPLVPDILIQAVIQRLLVTWQHPEDSLFREGAILVNREGQRFCCETVSPERETALSQQTDKAGYILLDERLQMQFREWPNFVSTAPRIAYAYIQDYQRLRPDLTTTGSSPTEIERKSGLPAGSLAESIRCWNRSAGRPLGGQSWMLLGPVKAWFTTTEGGAAVNRSLQVLDRTGQPVPGLYAIGQNGLGGMILWGHGLHIAWALTSGRLVAQAVADQSANSTVPATG